MSSFPKPSDFLKKEDGGYKTRPTCDCFQEDCPLYGKRRPVPISVPLENATLVCVGEAPGAIEDAQGVGFTGNSGKLLRKELKAIGIDTDKVAYMNVVRCRPSNNETPDSKTITACMKSFDDDWKELKDRKVILALGATAVKALLKARTIASVRGQVKNGAIVSCFLCGILLIF